MDRRYELGCGEVGDIASAIGLKIFALVRDGASTEAITEVAKGLDQVGWPEEVREVFVNMWVAEAQDDGSQFRAKNIFSKILQI